ncbi:hypothetical protein PIB30_055871 [Stylosanthes scabra]|uniref:Uncharacterized protein n=1 Tax=Stylosanthes scabra TaxID=79078 RepID=A0ABU6VHS5_9FABA|nr:hypothetical protein [Stylosanthes scabra]
MPHMRYQNPSCRKLNPGRIVDEAVMVRSGLDRDKAHFALSLEEMEYGPKNVTSVDAINPLRVGPTVNLNGLACLGLAQIWGH